MGSDPETLHTEGDETTEFTADQWQADLMQYFGGAAVQEPRQPDEFTVSDLVSHFGLGRWKARELCARNVALGKWAVRRFNNGNLYRIVKDG